MLDVNVSRDGLVKVKEILCQFKTDVEYIPNLIVQHAEEIQVDCQRKIIELKKQIVDLERCIKENEIKLELLQSKIDSNLKKVNENKDQIVKLEEEKGGIEARIELLNNQLSGLNGHFPNTEKEKRTMQNQILNNEQQIQNQRYCLLDIEKMIGIIENKIRDLEKENRIIQNDLNSTGTELQNQKKERNRKENVLERMKIAFNNIKGEISNLVSLIRSFTNNALSTANNNMAGVDQCIQHIDDYIATDL